MGLFKIKERYDKEIEDLQCPYCPNKFRGNNAKHSEELLDAHIKRKHPQGSSQVVI